MKAKLIRGVTAAAAAMALAGPVLAQPALPAADPRSVLSLTTENDSFAMGPRSDRWYTNGLRLGYASPEATLPPGAQWLDDAMAGVLGPAQSRWGVALGQSIYTPRALRRSVPNPLDRPYAGYAYVDASLDRRTETTLDRVSFTLGVVGPTSQGRQAQNTVHDMLGSVQAQGWHYQLKDEPTFNLGYQRIWRQRLVGQPGGLGADVLPAVDVAAGTVATYAQAGLRLRLGQQLEQDFGAPRARPAGTASGSPAPSGSAFGWYLFGGAAGRVVGRDLFLDGSTFRSNSPHVTKKNVVGDLELGGAVFWRGMRLSYTQDWRSPEFTAQRKWFTYGNLTLSVAF